MTNEVTINVKNYAVRIASVEHRNPDFTSYVRLFRIEWP